MDEHRSDSGDRSQKRQSHPNATEGTQFLLRTQEQIVQSISVRASLPDLLDRICSALDCQIADVVSLISLSREDPGDLAAIAANAALFGLYTFCSEGVVAENNELLGSLQMYSCVPRSPSASEIPLIERAKSLAAIAITFDNEAGHQGYCGPPGSPFVRGTVLEWPVSTN